MVASSSAAGKMPRAGGRSIARISSKLRLMNREPRPNPSQGLAQGREPERIPGAPRLGIEAVEDRAEAVEIGSEYPIMILRRERRIEGFERAEEAGQRLLPGEPDEFVADLGRGEPGPVEGGDDRAGGRPGQADRGDLLPVDQGLELAEQVEPVDAPALDRHHGGAVEFGRRHGVGIGSGRRHRGESRTSVGLGRMRLQGRLHRHSRPHKDVRHPSATSRHASPRVPAGSAPGSRPAQALPRPHASLARSRTARAAARARSAPARRTASTRSGCASSSARRSRAGAKAATIASASRPFTSP